MAIEMAASRAETVTFGSGEDSNLIGVSWGAVLAGAAAAAALSYALVILGFGLGLSSISPWAYAGATATTIGVATILWLTLTQIAASGLGGYIAGRLRGRWPTVHTHEVFFRDTAHGFLSWAVASLLVAAFLTTAIAGIISGGAKVAAAGSAGVGTGLGMGIAQNANPNADATAYYVDSLLRPSTGTPPNQSSPDPNDVRTREEMGRILARSITVGALSASDKQYLGQQLAARAGIDPAQGEQRVDEIYGQLQQSIESAKTKAKEAADQARKATAGIAVWMFISLLCGAFSASLAATFGGRHRDTFVYGPRQSHR
jgi:hypothetical protein